MSPATLAWSDLLEEHASEAGFLFELRLLAFSSWRQTLDSLAFLDERLIAHLDGLQVAPAKSWEMFGAGLGSDQAGEAFVAGWLALTAEGEETLEPLEGALAAPASVHGLSGALRLARGPAVEARLRRLAAREPLGVRALAHDALAFRGGAADAGTARAMIATGDPVARMVGVNLAARGRMRDQAGTLAGFADDPDAWLAARALQALALLDPALATARARAAAAREDLAGGAALRLLGAIGGPAEASWLAGQAGGPHGRDALLALGRLGDPAQVEVLIAACDDPVRARAAGHAFEILTGARLERDRLHRPEPPPPAPDEEPLEIDPDDGLAWPDPDRVRAAWQARSGQARRGERWRGGEAFEWEAVADEAADPFRPLPDRDDALMELATRLALDHAERRDWATRLRAAAPARGDVRRQAKQVGAGPWPQ